MGDVNNEGGYICVGVEGIWEISAASTKFYYKPKITPKKSYLLCNKQNKQVREKHIHCNFMHVNIKTRQN